SRLIDLGALVLMAGGIAMGTYTAFAIGLQPIDPQILPLKAFESAALFAGYGTLVLAALTPGTIVSRFLILPSLRRLGNISYSFYLLHGIPLHAFGLLAGRLHVASFGPQWVWLTFGAALPEVFLFTTAASALLYLCVEKPISLTRRVAAKDDRE